MGKDYEMKRMLDQYETFLVDNLQKYGPDHSLVTSKSWLMLMMGRMIDSLTDRVEEYETELKLLNYEYRKLQNENEALRDRLKNRT